MDEQQIRSLTQAKAILQGLQTHKTKGTAKQEILGEYTEVLGHLVDAIAKMATDERREEEEESCSVTLPETVVTTDSSYQCGGFLLDGCESVSGGRVGWVDDQVKQRPAAEHEHHQQQHHQQQQQQKHSHGFWRPDRAEAADYDDSDDDISESSDVIPLMMTDEDALDEISFTRELMGYEVGFEGETTNFCGPIIEEETPVEQHQRPPLPRPSLKKPSLSRSKTEESTQQQHQRQRKLKKAAHRRQLSGGSAPTVLEAVSEVVSPMYGQQQNHRHHHYHHLRRPSALTAAALQVHNKHDQPIRKRFPHAIAPSVSSAATSVSEEDPSLYDRGELTLCKLCSMPLPDGAACDCGTFEI